MFKVIARARAIAALPLISSFRRPTAYAVGYHTARLRRFNRWEQTVVGERRIR